MAAVHLPIVESACWPDEAATAACAARLASTPALRDAYIELHGELGAGKTTFVRHLLRELGVEGRIKSPTYAVVEPHEGSGGLAISHFDFYRFTDPQEWEDAGFRDIFASDGLKIAEWADHARSRLPVPDLVLRIEAMTDDTRSVSVEARTPRGLSLLQSIAP